MPITIDASGVSYAADSKGVKAWWYIHRNGGALADYDVYVQIHGYWDASNSDSEACLRLTDETASTNIVAISGNTRDGSSSWIKLTNSDHKLFLAFEVTTASATAGATVTLKAAIVYFKYVFY